MHPRIPAATLALALATTLPACTPGSLAPALPQAQAAATPASAPAPLSPARMSPAAATPTVDLPVVDVFKSPSCGCCDAWVEHLRQAGFSVNVHPTDVLEPLRRQLGVPFGKGSCHTAQVGGYVVEGHVPAADIRRLLEERPNARGLVLPGMPAGSPGMETADGYVQPYTVERIEHDGTTRAWAAHGR